jgi:outer membrane protein OmpA-like peptidoglycan-associated protein
MHFTRNTLCWLLLAAFLLGRGLGGDARAQTRYREADAQALKPAMDPLGVFTVESGRLLPPADWSFRAVVSLTNEPMNLNLGGPSAVTEPILDRSLFFQLQAAVGLLPFLQAGIELSLARQWLGASFSLDEPYGFAANDPRSNIQRWPMKVVMGDARAALKLGIFNRKYLQIALRGALILPFGDDTIFTGERFWAGEGRLILSSQLGPVLLAVNAGYLARKKEEILAPYDLKVLGQRRVLLEINDEVTWGLGAVFSIAPRVSLGVEIAGNVPVLAKGPTDMPMEAMGGVIVQLTSRASLTLGASAGLGRYIAKENGDYLGRSPDWSVFATTSFTTLAPERIAGVMDRDKDGIPDDKDQCPDEPEDKDGFEDEDGCPDPDNDQDGIPDERDKCPSQPEDVDGFEDEDGCPDPDNDGDGILDVDDRCPGVDADKAANFKNTVEDKDGFEDDDGCPDLDNDGDGIPDALDRCPNEPEDLNGVDDEDGCPEGGVGASLPPGGKIDLEGQQVMFRARSAQILPASFSLLDKVANTLRNNPGIQLVRIEGHTDNIGGAARNLRLSLDRAQAVLDYLVKRGVARERLTAAGYGDRRPKAPNTSTANRAANRRVEFIVVLQ